MSRNARRLYERGMYKTLLDEAKLIDSVEGKYWELKALINLGKLEEAKTLVKDHGDKLKDIEDDNIRHNFFDIANQLRKSDMRKNLNEFDKKIESLFPKVFETAPMKKVVKRNRMDGTIDFTNYMCKYTSQREKIPKLQREYHLLKVIYGKLSIETPNPIEFEIDEDSQLAAFIYKKLPGDNLLLVNPPPDQLLDMILELQQLSNHLDVMQIITEYTPETEIIKQRLTREKLQKHLTDLNNEQIEIILNFIQLCDNHLKIEKSQKTFVHGDLYFGNILMDRKSDRITGLIDFERGWFADPLIDFSKLSYNDRLLRTILELYDDRVGIDVDYSMGKALLYRGMFILRRMIDEWGPDIIYKTKNWIIKPYIEILDLL